MGTDRALTGVGAGFTPGVRDVAGVLLVCGVVYAMRHAGGTVAGLVGGVLGRLEAFRRPAR
jgi:hypothetical protein